MGWRGMRTVGVLGLGLLLAGGCDSTDSVSSELKNKPDKKKKDAAVAMEAGPADGGASSEGGIPPEDSGAPGDADCQDACPGQQPPTVSAGADQLTDEASTVTLTATASGDGGLSYQWTFVTQETSSGEVTCSLGSPSAASTTLTCNNDVIVFATVTVSDGHGSASDQVRVQFRNVIATAKLLAPPDGLVVKKDTPLGTLIELHEPSPVDALACLLWRDDDQDSNKAFFPPTRWADGRSTCDFPATNYLTQLTGMRTVLWQVAMSDQTDIGEFTHLVVWDADPRESVNGQGEMAACTSRATLAFAAHYPSSEATKPDGYFRLDDVAANMHFRSTGLDWFVVSRIRPSQPPERAAIFGKGKNGDKDCTFLLYARAPLPWEFEQGGRWGEARAQITCGEEHYDTFLGDLGGATDVDWSGLARFGSGYVHLVYPHEPQDMPNPCNGADKEGLDCTNTYTKNVTAGVCMAEKCVITCAAGWGNCDGLSSNGCELDLQTDSANCNACGSFCAGDCVQGMCQAGP
jgi:hypothetical protein